MSSSFTELWQPASDTAALQRPEEVLVATGQVTDSQLAEATRERDDNPHLSILDVLLRSKVIDELKAYQAIAESSKLPFVRVDISMVDREIVGMVPPEFLRSRRVLPLWPDGDKILVGLSDPSDIFLMDDLRERLGSDITPVVIIPSDIEAVLNLLGNADAGEIESIIETAAEDSVKVIAEQRQEVADLQRVAGESPVIRYVNYLISLATRQGASDIHVEPGEKRMYVRFRIDGILFDQPAPPLTMHPAITSRLKIMAGKDIAERRLPQDGRIRVTAEGRRMDLRFSTMPTAHGEKCVIRILDNRSILPGLESLGMSEGILEAFKKHVFQPRGITLVTGPTGSGKSTTLYSALNILDASSINICTVEDPVEYLLPRVNQVNAHEKIGLTFASVLRCMLRQDPDVIMVGEIRDAETAKVAIQASLTGHMVLATLHTNDAPSSITRLVNIGVEPYLLGASLNAILAQRLARRLCEHCKRPVQKPTDCVRSYMEKHGADTRHLWTGTGCERCRKTGYKGRIGLFEFLAMDEDLRDLISRGPSLSELRRAAKAAGMSTLAEDAIRKLTLGLTSAEEVMALTDV